MPESDVRIQFKINENGQKPLEKYLNNNILDSESFAIHLVKKYETERTFDLPYNALSRKIRFPLAEGEDITAHLTKPRGEWKKGSLATGSLNIEQKDSQILKGIKLFKSYSPKTIGVSENSDTIVLNPDVTATVERPVFGDDPLKKKWLNLPDPRKPKVLDGEFTYGGEVRRTYVYKRDTGLYDEDEIEIEGVAKAPFNPGSDRIFINAYIYNGKKDLKPPSFENKIENNGNMYLQKSLLWQSEPYPFDVIRWMCHIKATVNQVL
ncbi:hypothetical protein [Acetivibrio saccincola]|uniref:hypothetical protein n=1 Tax=Acetivibrio saccincola TaxID=1677857 RepID=UPI000C6CFC97|nr:hypothetical protein [Acetivibrio saccincola]